MVTNLILLKISNIMKNVANTNYLVQWFCHQHLRYVNIINITLSPTSHLLFLVQSISGQKTLDHEQDQIQDQLISNKAKFRTTDRPNKFRTQILDHRLNRDQNSLLIEIRGPWITGFGLIRTHWFADQSTDPLLWNKIQFIEVKNFRPPIFQFKRVLSWQWLLSWKILEKMRWS